MRNSAAIACIVLLATPAKAFHSFPGGATHNKLCTDAIEIQLSPTDYPDIHKYKTTLIAACADESSHEDTWFGDIASWQSRARDSFGLGNYEEAYKRDGLAVHLLEDAQVPAHQATCRHGSHAAGALPLDGLENYAHLHHLYSSAQPDTPSFNIDEFGHAWHYWLKDDEDDDDHDERIVDANDLTESDGQDGIESFGIRSTWGTYGRGVFSPPSDLIPGKDEGTDWYDGSIQDASITYQQLYKALEKTRLELKEFSEKGRSDMSSALVLKSAVERLSQVVGPPRGVSLAAPLTPRPAAIRSTELSATMAWPVSCTKALTLTLAPRFSITLKEILFPPTVLTMTGVPPAPVIVNPDVTGRKDFDIFKRKLKAKSVA